MNIVQRLLLFDGGNSLPRTGLLFYSRLPNAYLPIDWDEELGWESPMRGYQATPGDDALFAALGGGFWYADVNTPIAKSAAEILAWSGVNQYHVLFSATKGFVVYNPSTVTGATLQKANNYMFGSPATATPILFNGQPIIYSYKQVSMVI